MSTKQSSPSSQWGNHNVRQDTPNITIKHKTGQNMEKIGSDQRLYKAMKQWLVWDVKLCKTSQNWLRSVVMQAHEAKKVKRKVQGCQNHKLQPIFDTKGMRKQTQINKHKINKCTKSTQTSFFIPKWGNCKAKRTEKHKDKTQGKT